MRDFPWWIIPVIFIAISALAALISKIYGLAFGDIIVRGGYSDGRVTLSDLCEGNKKAHDFITANNLRSLNDMAVKHQIEAAKASAALEQEIQCEGCGYFHNLRRCPKCTRMKASKISWVSDGSKDIKQWVPYNGGYLGRAISDAAHDKIYYLTPHKSQGG